MATSNQGGRAAHASGNAHEFTSEEARAAGSKSGGSGGTRAGTPEQNAEAGRQSQKKDS